MKRVTAKAPVNIALIKYWGKKDKVNIIPYNSSISITLDNLYTVTTIEESSEFSFYLNGRKQSKDESQRVMQFLQNFASNDEINTTKILSTNYVPTAAGLASSASGFAALAIAANEYFNSKFSFKELTAITRIGSGSACRSLLGGFVAWIKSGEIYEIDSPIKDFILISVLIEEKQKPISSREAMEITVNTSSLFPFWTIITNRDFIDMKHALTTGNYELIGELTEKSARLMHATMLAANPPILYIKEESLIVWNLIQTLRKKGIYAYVTMDAGPNVKILTKTNHQIEILDELKNLGFNNCLVSRMGEGAGLIYE
jgi:diphosphomevalonate decarboxylase